MTTDGIFYTFRSKGTQCYTVVEMCFMFSCTFDVCHIQLDGGFPWWQFVNRFHSRRGTLHYGLISKWNARFACWMHVSFCKHQEFELFREMEICYWLQQFACFAFFFFYEYSGGNRCWLASLFVCKNINVTPFVMLQSIHINIL